MHQMKRQRVYDIAPMEGLVVPPLHASGVLENALLRYLAMNCVMSGVIPLKQVLKDRTEHFDLYTAGTDGEAELHDANQVEFMHRVSGLPRSWCAYWTYMDWLSTVAEGHIEGDIETLVQDGYESALELTEELPD